MASRSLSDLTPAAREKCLRWIDACKSAGIDVLVYCTYRSPEEQDEIYKIGRTVPGANVSAKKPMGDTVTSVRGGESDHQKRIAWDAVPLSAGKAMWKDNVSYARMGDIAESMGVAWAGRWKGKLKETAHFSYKG